MKIRTSYALYFPFFMLCFGFLFHILICLQNKKCILFWRSFLNLIADTLVLKRLFFLQKPRISTLIMILPFHYFFLYIRAFSIFLGYYSSSPMKIIFVEDSRLDWIFIFWFTHKFMLSQQIRIFFHENYSSLYFLSFSPYPSILKKRFFLLNIIWSPI